MSHKSHAHAGLAGDRRVRAIVERARGNAIQGRRAARVREALGDLAQARRRRLRELTHSPPARASQRAGGFGAGLDVVRAALRRGSSRAARMPIHPG